jgi:glutamate dehydrogenase/leucine dehydrogenase
VKFAQISEADMKEWLTYLSSDELQGRQIYTEGYGLAAQYIADHLKDWGVKPIGRQRQLLPVVEDAGLSRHAITRRSRLPVPTARRRSRTATT